MESSMQAIHISAPGLPTVLQLCQRPLPVPQAGEVLIKVHAAGVNRPDVLQRKGMYAPPPGASDLPGLEIAGEIVAFGSAESALEGATEFVNEGAANVGLALGDRVCALVAGGGYAQYCTAPVGQCLPVPHGWSMLQAAGLPETMFTVWSNVFQRARLAKGESLLVQGGSSGIGVTAIQLAHALGHRVLATAGSEEKCRACEALGAERGIHYRDEDFSAVVKELTGGRGVDVILDMVGGDYLPREIDCLADDGRIVLIALQRGVSAPLDMAQVLRRRLTITGSTLRPRDVAFKAAIAQDLLKQVWPLLENGQIKPVIFQTFPLAQAAAAHALMETSSHIGKIMLQVLAEQAVV